LVDAGVDTLVLGCTHYPLLSPLIARVVGPSVRLVDSAEAVAAEVGAGLAERGLLAPAGAREDHVFVTDGAERFARLAGVILGREVRLEWVDVGDEADAAVAARRKEA
jgi:glutamate racemase